jgi:hypothetical protein
MTTRLPSTLWLAVLLAIPAGCGVTGSGGQAVQGPNTPGWTGRTAVVGSTSTIAGDAAATEQQQKWPVGRGR